MTMTYKQILDHFRSLFKIHVESIEKLYKETLEDVGYVINVDDHLTDNQVELGCFETQSYGSSIAEAKGLVWGYLDLGVDVRNDEFLRKTWESIPSHLTYKNIITNDHIKDILIGVKRVNPEAGTPPTEEEYYKSDSKVLVRMEWIRFNNYYESDMFEENDFVIFKNRGEVEGLVDFFENSGNFSYDEILSNSDELANMFHPPAFENLKLFFKVLSESDTIRESVELELWGDFLGEEGRGFALINWIPEEEIIMEHYQKFVDRLL